MLTRLLIAVNVAVFVVATASTRLGRDLALWPPAVADGQLYRLATSAFEHYGVLHLLLNMWALYVLGPPLEAWLGRLRFTALYASSALGGSTLVYLLAPLDTATAGASGAIFGLFGAIFVLAKPLKLDIHRVSAVLAVNLVFTFVAPLISSQSISWQGHLGGLATGAVIALAYAHTPTNRSNLLTAAATIAAVVAFALLIWWRTSYLLAEVDGHFVLG